MTTYITIEQILEKLGLINVGYQDACKINNITEMMKDKNILLYDHYLTHDGYDEYGPKSDLFDIFIVTCEEDKYIFYEFHVENWYGSLKEEIELIKSYVLNKENLKIIKKHYFIQNTDSGKQFVKNMKKLIS